MSLDFVAAKIGVEVDFGRVPKNKQIELLKKKKDRCRTILNQTFTAVQVKPQVRTILIFDFNIKCIRSIIL